jgi:hypothetical protein
MSRKAKVLPSGYPQPRDSTRRRPAPSTRPSLWTTLRLRKSPPRPPPLQPRKLGFHFGGSSGFATPRPPPGALVLTRDFFKIFPHPLLSSVGPPRYRSAPFPNYLDFYAMSGPSKPKTRSVSSSPPPSPLDLFGGDLWLRGSEWLSSQ